LTVVVAAALNGLTRMPEQTPQTIDRNAAWELVPRIVL
jgi:hypothetical protein